MGVGVCVKKVENEGCFLVKIVEKGGFVKKGGVLFAKCGPFFNAGCIMYSISIFYILLIWGGGGVRNQRTPLPTGLPNEHALATHENSHELFIQRQQ